MRTLTGCLTIGIVCLLVFILAILGILFVAKTGLDSW